MNTYIQIRIENISANQSEILIAQLSELGFDGFEESENLLTGYIQEKMFDEKELQHTLSLYQLRYTKQFLEEKNWNEEWEKNFDPVIINDFVAVRADFHQPIKKVQHEIIITPKMSFGTGHHATTYMMMEQMRSIDFNNKTVFDFGTGTGVLAILAEKLGASDITAIDNDEWSINNARENINKNNCKHIRLKLSEMPDVDHKKYDIILANINKNVIIVYIKQLANALDKNAHLLVSGLLREDENDILFETNNLALKHIITLTRDTWISILFMN